MANFSSLELHQALEKAFGYRYFRPHQEEIIQAILGDRHVFIELATGAGKSLCYQLPALLGTGLSVVISPLMALMHDQVAALHFNGINAAYWDSSLSATEKEKLRGSLQQEGLRLLYISPERFKDRSFTSLLQKVKLERFIIDEAHCISQWGHDFRQEYLNLSVLSKLFPNTPRIALTATADALTRQDIIRALNLTSPIIFRHSHPNKNLHRFFIPRHHAKTQLLRFLKSRARNECGLIYCGSRYESEKIANFLRTLGYSSFCYHAGLSHQERQNAQYAFYQAKKGIMVATTAFGLGIDKSNIRFVAHFGLPSSLEQYLQGEGRAGRDGKGAISWLCFGLNDYVILNERIKNSDLAIEQKQRRLKKLRAMLYFCDHPDPVFLHHYFTHEEPAKLVPPKKGIDHQQGVLQILSLIYYTDQEASIKEIIQILRVEENSVIDSFNLHKNRLFAIGAHRSQRYWRSLLRHMIGRDLVEVSNYYQLLRFTRAGLAFLRDKPDFFADLSIKEEHYPPPLTIESERERKLQEALYTLREHLIEKQGMAVGYLLEPNLIQAIVRKKARNFQELSEIEGFNDAKLKLFGNEVVRLSQEIMALTPEEQFLQPT